MTKPKGLLGQSVSALAREMAAASAAKREAEWERERWLRDKEMVENPDRWPNWPRLTLKPRPQKGVQPNWDVPGAFGVILDTRPITSNTPLGPPYRVYWTIFSKADDKSREYRDYATVEALLRTYTVD